MEHFFESWLNTDTHALVLLLVIVVSLVVLAKAADWLVAAAVSLSVRTGLPKVVIGVTVVSLGTTTPEAAVSVMAAVGGDPGLALGNAVGSIICDTGLILGLAATLRPLPIDRENVWRQSWIQLGAGLLLVIGCWPFAGGLGTAGNLPQWMGFVLLGLLVGYLWFSVRWAKRQRVGPGELGSGELESGETSLAEAGEGAAATNPAAGGTPRALLILVGSLGLVVVASSTLIPAVRATAEKAGVPESIIAATLVAFGTSLPELVTAVTATLRGHGELAIGNVVGADILNVFFVAGASAAVTPDGLDADPHFSYFYFPVMMAVLVLLRVGLQRGGTELRRGFGVTLLVVYGVYLTLNTLFFT